MRRILLLLILGLIFCFAAFGQECPIVKIIPPSKFEGDKPLLFSVSIVGKIDSSEFKYKWSFSDGEIFDGQGTSAISVLLNKDVEGVEVKATIEIGGLPEGCRNTFTEAVMTLLKPQCRCKEGFGKIPWIEEANEIIGFLNELDSEPTLKALLIFTYKSDSERNLILNRQRMILNLLDRYKFPSYRFMMIIKKGDKYFTHHWIIPEYYKKHWLIPDEKK